MSVTLLPDIEALVSQFLRDQDEIVALVDDRVYTAIPNDPTWPLLRLQRVAGAPVLSRPLHVDAPVVQLDAYGGSKSQARTLIETARAVIAARLEGVHALGVVAGVTFGSMSWLPDTAYSPARSRFVADFVATVRPL